ncbi:MAG TPA: ABC transporter substrate-binding protein [Spirochaetia bacterium]|nr:ABC transporter substrate-binding protein [Spirochaetia bacterium]
MKIVSLKRALLVSAFLLGCGAMLFAGGTSEGSQEKAKVIYWSMFSQGETVQQILEPAISEFMAENPNIEVEAIWQGRGVLTKIQAAVSAGEQVDLVSQSNDLLISTVVKANLALALDKYLDAKAYDTEQPWKDTFIKNALEVDRMPDGHIYTVPRDDYVGTFWYDKTVFDQMGITPKTLGMTWSEFIKMLDSIRAKRPEMAPLAIRGAQSNNMTNVWTSCAMIREAGPKAFYDAAFDKTGQLWATNKDFLKGMQKLWSLIQGNYYQKGYEGYVRPQEEQIWVDRKGGMVLAHGWLPSEAKGIMPPDFQARMFGYPSVDGGKGNDYISHYSNGYAILNTSKNPDATAKLLKYILSKKVGTRLGGVVPTGLAVVPQPPTHDKQPEIVGSYKLSAQYAGTLRESPEWLTTVYNKVDGQFWSRKVDAEGFIQALAAETKAFWANK